MVKITYIWFSVTQFKALRLPFLWAFELPGFFLRCSPSTGCPAATSPWRWDIIGAVQCSTQLSTAEGLQPPPAGRVNAVWAEMQVKHQTDTTGRGAVVSCTFPTFLLLPFCFTATCLIFSGVSHYLDMPAALLRRHLFGTAGSSGHWKTYHAAPLPRVSQSAHIWMDYCVHGIVLQGCHCREFPCSSRDLVFSEAMSGFLLHRNQRPTPLLYFSILFGRAPKMVSFIHLVTRSNYCAACPADTELAISLVCLKWWTVETVEQNLFTSAFVSMLFYGLHHGWALIRRSSFKGSISEPSLPPVLYQVKTVLCWKQAFTCILAQEFTFLVPYCQYLCIFLKTCVCFMKKLFCAAAKEQHSLPMPTPSFLPATLHAVCPALSRHALPNPGHSSTLCVLLHVSAEPFPWLCSWHCPLLPRAWLLRLAWLDSCQTVLSSLLWLSHSLTVLIAFSNTRLSSFSNFSCIIFVIDPIKFLSFSMSSPALKAKSFVVSCSWITYVLIAFVGPRFRS